MNDRPDLERIVADWLRAGAPPRAPERVLEGVLDRVGVVGQERPLGGRWFDAWVGNSTWLRWAIVGVLLAIAVLAGVAVAGALLRESPVRPPGAVNGWVAYSQHSPLGSQDARSTPMDLYLVHEGIKPHRIAGSDSDLIRAVCPTFSQDGKRLAYAESTNPQGINNNTYSWATRVVVILRLDGSGWPIGPVIRIPVLGEIGDPCPAWSPDGGSLAFLAGAPAQLVTVRVGEPTKIVPLEGAKGLDVAQFAFSPNGEMIATSGPSGIWLVPTDGSTPRRLLDSGTQGDIAWSPDGSRIVTVVDSSIEVFHLDGKSQALGNGYGPVWSPDGKRIAFELGDAGRDIVVANPDGSDSHAIALASLGTGAYYTSSWIVWSPDGNQLVFASWSDLISVSATGDPAPRLLVTGSTGISNTGISWQEINP